MSLEAFQSGLSWRVILRKRPAFRAAFSGFDVEAVRRANMESPHRKIYDGEPAVQAATVA